MNKKAIQKTIYRALLAACAGASLLLTACAGQAEPTTVLPEQPTAAAQPTPTIAIQPTEPASGLTGELALDASAVSSGLASETVEAVFPATDVMWWQVAPGHRRVTLEGYPVSPDQRIMPQVFVYPAEELSGSSANGMQIVGALQILLESKQAGDTLPFMPMYNSVQAFHAQVQYLDFKNGSGVRYLTQYNQGLAPVNNAQLVYTFQGLTGDGKYYVAAVLPVTHPELPATSLLSPEQANAIGDYRAYMAKTTEWLGQQPAGSFTPDLAKLDTLVQSIEIQ